MGSCFTPFFHVDSLVIVVCCFCVSTEQSLSMCRSTLTQLLATSLSLSLLLLLLLLPPPSLLPSLHIRSSENVCWWGRSPPKSFQPQEHCITSIGPNPQLFRRQFTTILFHPAPAEAGGSEGAVHEWWLHGGLHIPPLWGHYGNESKGEKRDSVYLKPHSRVSKEGGLEWG